MRPCPEPEGHDARAARRPAAGAAGSADEVVRGHGEEGTAPPRRHGMIDDIAKEAENGDPGHRPDHAAHDVARLGVGESGGPSRRVPDAFLADYREM
jgi:hypothetical protein